MGLTLVEKIISEHAGKNVHAGELVISKANDESVRFRMILLEYPLRQTMVHLIKKYLKDIKLTDFSLIY